MPVPLNTLQQQVMRLLLTGATDSQIARNMELSSAEVQRTLSGLYALFDVSSRIELMFAMYSSERSQKSEEDRG